MSTSAPRSACSVLRRLRPRVAAPTVPGPGLGRFPSRRSIATAASAATAPANGQQVDSRFPRPTAEPELDPRLPLTARRQKIREAKPFSAFLTDSFNRQHDYLRISLTEKCNLRCVYCMPEEGVPLSPPRELLTTPEIVLLSSAFVSQGVTKIRLTGGEPTVRRDIVPLMHQIGSLRAHGLRELCLTTNGLALHRKLETMVEAGLTGVNLSLDTLDPWQFQLMTRRDGLAAVRRSIDRVLELNRAGAGIRLKINCVVMRGLNDREILPFVDMTRDEDLEVRFIEYMPFDGNRWSKGKMFSYDEMLGVIRAKHPSLRRLEGHRNDTSKTYQVPGFRGKVGFITSMTHNFCGTCNRLRITSDGNLKVCLFGDAEVSLRDVLRQTNAGEPIDEAALEAMTQAALAKAARLQREQLSSEEPHHHPQAAAAPLAIPNSQELFEVIGAAVKRKKAKHAGIGELEHMKNRPMILIDTIAASMWNKQRQQHCASLSPNAPPRPRVPLELLTSPSSTMAVQGLRMFSTGRSRWKGSSREDPDDDSRANNQPSNDTANTDAMPKLTHVSASGTAHMVSISAKPVTSRTAVAACTVVFSLPTAATLVRENQMAKGDVLGVARVAGIMAAKRTPDLIPLCHPVALSRVAVDLEISPAGGESAPEAPRVEIRATAECDGKTGVEMEALTAAAAAALTVYDMCKAVDKGMRVEGLRVVLKEGGKSGRWVEGAKVPGE